jgi:multiple sugar transport system substrate-binding protein
MRQAWMQTSIAGNNVPALFTWAGGTQLADLVTAGAAADLSEYWDAAIASGNFSAGQRDLVSVDGKPRAVLLGVFPWVMFYNTHLFEEAGIAGPPKTWEELMDASEKLKAAGYTPFNGSHFASFVWFEQLVMGQDPDALIGLGDGSVAYNSPVVQKAFEIWSDMYAKGYFTDVRDNDLQKEFLAGRAAMYLIGEWDAGIVEAGGMAIGTDFKSFIVPPVLPGVEPAVAVEAVPIVFGKSLLESNPDMGKAVTAMLSVDVSNILSSSHQVYNGNLLAEPPNSIIKEDAQAITDTKARQLLRWTEYVPPAILGDLISQLDAFRLDPTPENAKRVMDNMETINRDYWNNQ